MEEMIKHLQKKYFNDRIVEARKIISKDIKTYTNINGEHTYFQEESLGNKIPIKGTVFISNLGGRLCFKNGKAKNIDISIYELEEKLGANYLEASTEKIVNALYELIKIKGE